ncbi:MAG: VOC family protein [Deltaproteobacteria bacterium]|nr:VOC family protein [Deltaproteobacteria bacterium]
MVKKAAQSWSLKMTAPLESGIVCNDIEPMLKFYVDVLGLRLVADASTTPELSRRLGGTPHGYRIVRLQTPYGERIKLVQPAKRPPKPNPVPEWLYERHGMAYLTFVIDGIKRVAKHLKGHGVKLISDEPIEVRNGVFALYSIDPEGNFIEFVEYPDIASYRPDLVK